MPQEGAQGILEQRLVAPQDRAAQDAALAVDVLGRRVDDEIGTERERLLEDRGGEDVVDDEKRPVGAAQLGQCGDVEDLHGRIGRGLDQHKPRLGPEHLPHRVDTGGVHHVSRNPVARQPFTDQPARRPEEHAVRQHALAGLEQREQTGRDRRHAGGGGTGESRVLEQAQPLLEHVHGGIGLAAVGVARRRIGEAPLGLRQRIIGEAAGQKQRLARLVQLAAARAAAHRPRLLAPVRRDGRIDSRFRLHVPMPRTKNPDRSGSGLSARAPRPFSELV